MSFFLRRLVPMASGNTGGGNTGGNTTDLVGIAFDAKSREVGQAAVELPVVPEILLTTADATVHGLDGEAGAVVPLGHTTGVVGHLLRQPTL